jgi:predicted O-methyltransferase YrrM
MNDDIWGDVDDYIGDRLVKPDATMGAVIRANAAAGLPSIDVSPAQGKFLSLLIRMSGAKRVLEIGTLGGYSSIWMARALPEDGTLVTLEYSPKHAEVAKKNIESAGLSGKVTLHVGAAAETLPKLAAENPEPFDFIFIDADKPSNPVYLDWAIKLGRKGTVIFLDNVVRSGRVIDAASTDGSVVGTRAAFDMISAEPRLAATALQTVGAKGWDGFALMMLE